MSAYLVISYDISDADGYTRYNPGSMGAIMATVAKHGGSIVWAGPQANVIDGAASHTSICLKFATAEAANAWHDDPDYAAAKAIRLATTSNISAFVMNGFVRPS